MGQPGSEISLRLLDATTLKQAYRRAARKSHPDHSRALGRDESTLTAEFQQLAADVQLLRRYISGRIRSDRRTRSKPAAASGVTHDHLWTAGVPGHRLHLAEFLYYSRAIPWSHLTGALAWQQAQRAPLGKAARRRGWLSNSSLSAIVRSKRPGETFGECAIRLGCLTRWQVAELVALQSRTQQPIGTYFVRNRLLSDSQIRSYLRKLQQHNGAYSSPS